MSYPGFNAYKIYLALKSHFTSDYDYFKYHGKMRVKEESFLKRRDKFFFEKIERRYKKELVPFFVSNLIKEDNAWSGSLATDQAEQTFNEWKKKTQSLRYVFKEDMGKIRALMDHNDLQFDELFDCGDGQHPAILKLLISEDISIESFVILDQVLSFAKRINRILLDDFTWIVYYKKVIKYSRFIEVDKKEYRMILKDIFV
jgi:hypothetical protein|tara:strand:+ start:377 stop:979 length:603 start_codon:yes stop_codon:yes gene_type:complete